ncbi:MAG: DegT/DnrJ/EryC1/StrS family aminotransferase [Candidatus Calescibacterium sp.]|jgi:dTDP-4-amino-4,6-dideoxygalactose transaminase
MKNPRLNFKIPIYISSDLVEKIDLRSLKNLVSEKEFDFYISCFSADRLYEKYKKKLNDLINKGKIKLINPPAEYITFELKKNEKPEVAAEKFFKLRCEDGIIINEEKINKRKEKENSKKKKELKEKKRKKENIGTVLKEILSESVKEFQERIEAKKVEMLNLKRFHNLIYDELELEIKKWLCDTNYILGQRVEDFERELSNYLGVKHCVGVASGTDALVLALRAMAIKMGKEFFSREDKIITTPLTFTATAIAIIRSGATPVFVDIDPKTFNISPEKIEEYLQKDPKGVVGIVPVHIYGLPCYMDSIMEIAKKYNLFVIEDTAQALGAEIKGKKVGTIGDIGCHSFYPSKNLGGFGDGGAISTNDDEIAEIVRKLREYGGKSRFIPENIGYNSRLDAVQAALLKVKLKYVDKLIEVKNKIAQKYKDGLKDLEHELEPPYIPDGMKHSFHQYTIKVKRGEEVRQRLKEFLEKKGIGNFIYYPVFMHKIQLFFKLGAQIGGSLEISEDISRKILSIPIDPLLTNEEVNRVINAINEFFSSTPTQS